MTKRGWTRRGALVAATGAAAACAPNVETPPYEGIVAFSHGVASGDPKQDRVVIWSRVSPQQSGDVPVRWIVARNRELSDVVKTGVIVATEARDYTVKADVTGLRPGAPYFYGFRAGAAASPVGKTRTLPRGQTNTARIAVVSCSSYSHGFFNAYEALAQRDDIDLVVHLGDYLYEYGLSGYGGDVAIQLGRVPAPEVECVSLNDYRARHAQHKAEAELQAAHALAPWVVVWDDHETANDSFATGAENHDEGEGQFAARKQAALQAYYEWMPIRDPEPGRAFEAINRSFDYGDLFTLIMLETRLLARTEPLDYATQLPVRMQRWNFTSETAAVALRDHEPDTATMRRLPAIYEEVGEELRPVLDWRRAGPMAQNLPNLPNGFYLAPDVDAITALLNAPERQLMGTAQEQWLADELNRSKRAGATWQVIGNQVLMAPVSAPDLSKTPPQLAAALERLRPGVTQLLKLTRFPFPLNTDSWDGYPGPRSRVLATMRAAGGNALVLTGDTHTAWANEIDDGQGRVAVEFGATSITSPSEAEYFTPAGVDFNAAVRARNPHVKHTDGLRRGFLLLTLTKEQATAEFFAVSTILSKEYETTRAAAFTVAPDAGAGVGPITAVE
ncbi:MAG TPA: alkaline phosphatase D family protein [Vitreimonas sp.]|uniref:alkaline phosphatase D family protein n=1 Tax=Vitreimonas sp. TaxID=3069702 RepID=UPI002D5B5063|nr:alkaline phosphatase D family protein [Vitreimonas sp.]HYD86971.1 alkaline phosphatase D family protein [Vitreimonas sp.]